MTARKFIKQLLCMHLECSWTTERISETETRTTGGCAKCGKPIAPPGQCGGKQ